MVIESYSSPLKKHYNPETSMLSSCDHIQYMKELKLNHLQQIERSNVSTEESVRHDKARPQSNIGLFQHHLSPIKNEHSNNAVTSGRRVSEFVAKKLYLPSVQFRAKYLNKLKSKKNLIGFYIKFSEAETDSSKSINTAPIIESRGQRNRSLLGIPNDTSTFKTSKTKKIILSRVLQDKQQNKEIHSPLTKNKSSQLKICEIKAKFNNIHSNYTEQLSELDQSESSEEEPNLAPLPYKDIKRIGNTNKSYNILNKGKNLLANLLNGTHTQALLGIKKEFSKTTKANEATFHKGDYSHKENHNPAVTYGTSKWDKSSTNINSNSKKFAISKNDTHLTHSLHRKSILVNKTMVMLPNGKVRLVDKIEKEIEIGRNDRLARNVVMKQI